MSGIGKPGYLVRATLSRGAASKNGICVGDLITSVAGKPVNAKGALGRILQGYKSGARVSVHLTTPDGRKAVKKVVLGGKKGSSASLGVISGKRAARNYNAKLESTRAIAASKAIAKAIAPVAPKAIAPKDKVEDKPKKKGIFGSFRRKADDEIELAHGLLEDRKAADDFKSARNLRRELEEAGRRNLKESQNMVSDYLDALSREKTAEIEAKVGPKTASKLSAFSKLVIAVASLGSASAIGYGVYYTMAVL